ncbi:hypothetical protein PENTCL1PPCAC_11850, partial [Pristionchus entomophagus]
LLVLLGSTLSLLPRPHLGFAFPQSRQIHPSTNFIGSRIFDRCAGSDQHSQRRDLLSSFELSYHQLFIHSVFSSHLYRSNRECHNCNSEHEGKRLFGGFIV